MPTLFFKKVWKVCEVFNALVTASHRPAQAQEELGGGRCFFPFLCGVTEIFGEIESTFLNSRVFAGGFVMECAKKSWF